MTQRAVVVRRDIPLTCTVLTSSTQPHFIVHQRLSSDHAYRELGTTVFTTCVPAQEDHCSNTIHPLELSCNVGIEHVLMGQVVQIHR